MRFVAALILFLSSSTAALACSCGGSSPFLTMAARSDLVVLGTVEAHSDHGMDFRIDAVYRGNEQQDLIRVWGDNGGLCRPFVRTLPVNTQWVLSLMPTGAEGPGGPPGQQYALDGCGMTYLQVTGDAVYLADRRERWQLERLTREIAALDVTPPPTPQDEEQRLREFLAARGVLDAGAYPAASAAPPEKYCTARLLEGIEGLSVSSIEPIVAGGIDAPAGAGDALFRTYGRLPEICRLTGVFIPTRDDVMRFELWIPRQAWSGESLGKLFETPMSIFDLASAFDTDELSRGTALFGLSQPRTARTLMADPAERFRGIVARLHSATLDRTRSFLGSSSMISGGMNPGRMPMDLVSRGPGRIEGQVNLQGEPLPGLPMRIALNGNLWSPWLTTDAYGRYRLDLPYGEYSIDAYQIDFIAADRLLTGALDHPQQSPRIESLTVDDSGPARGIDLNYVYPVELEWPAAEVPIEQAGRIAWTPYPGADHYRVSISRNDGQSLIDGVRTFWGADNIRTTVVDLPIDEIRLAPGEYRIRLVAQDADGGDIASLAGFLGFPFRIVE